MALIFVFRNDPDSEKVGDREWAESWDIDKKRIHGVGLSGSHSLCGNAFEEVAEYGYGKITCPNCIKVIEFTKEFKKGIDYDTEN